MFGPQDILRPPHARSRPFCYPSLPAHAQITRDYLVYILSSLELGCAGVRQGLRAIHPSFLGSEKAPPDEAHTRSRFSLDLYSRACAPGNVFRHGHGHVREALTSPLGSSPSSGRARSSSHLQTAVLAHGLTTQRRGENSARRDI